MSEHGIRPAGTRLEGDQPKELILSDGSRLTLESAPEAESVRWCRQVDGRTEAVSIGEARELAGPEFGEYVAVRTRSEAEWLRALAQWAHVQAERLDEEAAVLS